jgi:hypothetical protein
VVRGLLLGGRTGQYLERYLAGECQPVWAELRAQGAAIRHDPLASEAWAVAEETMRRVRYNIALLIPRLRALGYRFGEIPHDPGWEEWERDFVKAYPVFQLPSPETARRLDELEQRVGVLPLSIRAFYLEIDGVNFIGVDPWIPDGGSYDPLFVEPLAKLPEWPVEEEDLEPGQEGATDLILSPDALTKYNTSGADSYMMTVPNVSIDGVFDIYKKTTFVEYLRASLLSGGLLGLEQTERIGELMHMRAYLRGEPAPTSAIIAHYEEQVEEALAYLRQAFLPI